MQIDGRDIDLIRDSQRGRDIAECVRNPCSASPCSNGGTCIVEAGEFTCLCPLGYAGRTCNTAGECKYSVLMIGLLHIIYFCHNNSF